VLGSRKHLLLACCALAGTAALPAQAIAQEAGEQPPAQGGDADEIVVTGRAPPGAVIGDIPPENQLDPADIAAYGVGTIAELLDEIAAQTQSAQGREESGPVVLVNGKRISGVNEVSDLPTEAIVRLDILPEEVALKYGYDAQRKVVNVILRRRFQAWVGSLSGGLATQGGGEQGRGDLTYTRIRDNDRLNIAARVSASADLLEGERGVVPERQGATDPTGTIDDDTFYRTLRPEARDYQLNATMANELSSAVSLSLNARGSYSSSDALRGLPSGTLSAPADNPFAASNPAVIDRFVSFDPLAQDRTVATLSSGLSLNADLWQSWRLSFTGAYNHGETRTATDRGYDLAALQAALDAGDASVDPYGALPAALLGDRQRERAKALADSGNASVLANGKLLALPAGDVGVSLRASTSLEGLRSTAIRDGVADRSSTHGSETGGQISLDLPIASRSKGVLGFLGRLTGNANGAVTRVSDFGTLATFGYGLNWAPFTGLSILASVNQDRRAPALEQRSAPSITTENVQVFDYVTGESVSVRRISGGNPDLLADDRRVFKLGATIKPDSDLDLTFSASYVDSRTRNGTMALGAASAVVQAAFPDRFERDGAGTLFRIDASPVNIASEDRRQLRWGINFTQVLRAPQRPAPPPGMQFRPGGDEGRGARPPRMGREGPVEPEADGTEDGSAAAAAREDQPAGAEGDEIVVRGERAEDPEFLRPPDGFGGPGGFGPPGGRGPPPGGFGGPGGGPGGRGGGRAGPGGGFAGGSDNGARLQLSLYHDWTFENTVLLREGTGAIDLLDGGTLRGTPLPRHRVQLSSGVTDNGLGLRLNGSWQSSSRILAGQGAASGDLSFASLVTLDLRLFANLANRFPGEKWARGTRVSLSARNLLNARQDVRDATGATPLAYQPALLDPLGRTVELSLRRLF